jgi:hypothetical protein
LDPLAIKLLELYPHFECGSGSGQSIVVDPKLFFTDPDPTFRQVSDSDPTFVEFRIRIRIRLSKSFGSGFGSDPYEILN